MFHTNKWAFLAFFALMPFAMILFVGRLGWGTNGLFVAIIGSGAATGLGLLLARKIKRVLASLGNRSDTMAFMIGADHLLPPGNNKGLVSYGQGTYADQQEVYEVDAVLVSEEEIIGGASKPPAHPIPPERLPENRFRLILGSHTFDLASIYSHLLVLEQFRAGTQGVLRVLLEELARLSVPFLLIDTYDAFLTLLPELGDFGIAVSSSAAHSSLTSRMQVRSMPIDLERGDDTRPEAHLRLVQQAASFGHTLMQHGWHAVFRFSSYESPSVATEVLLAMLQGMQKWERDHVVQGHSPLPSVIAFTDAYRFFAGHLSHSVVSADREMANKLHLHLHAYLKAQGMYGIYLWLVTGKISGMSHEALQNCGLWFLRDLSAGEYETIGQYTGVAAQDLEDIPTHEVLLIDPDEEEFHSIAFRDSRTIHERDDQALSRPFQVPFIDAFAIPALPAPSIAAMDKAQGQVTTEHLGDRQAEAKEQTERLSLAPGMRRRDFSEAELAWACIVLFGRESRWRTYNAVNDPPVELRPFARALGFNPRPGAYLFNPQKGHRLFRYTRERLVLEERAHYMQLARERLQAWQIEREAPREATGAEPVEVGRQPGRSAPDPPRDKQAAGWRLPTFDDVLPLPQDSPVVVEEGDGDDLIREELASLVQEALRSFKVLAEVRTDDISISPTIIRIGIRPTGKPLMKTDGGRPVEVRDARGHAVYEERTKSSSIMARQNDLALVLEAKTIRMEAPVPGRPYVGVEIPNKNGRIVRLREILESAEYQSAKARSKLAIALGWDLANIIRVGDLARMPHLLIAGATGSGKSVMINTILGSFLTQATPDDLRLLLVDPKLVELSMYNGVPHLLAPVVTNMDWVIPLLLNATREMKRRYRVFAALNVRNIDGYRRKREERLGRGDNSLDPMPAIVIVIDELYDLMVAVGEDAEKLLQSLAQLARATGIHLVVATQRPSVDVITGSIKTNFPTRIAFMMSSFVDSRTIIDMGGAERLLGRGDMLYLPADAGRPERMQSPFLTDDEAERLADWWRAHAVQLRQAYGNDLLMLKGSHQRAIDFDWTRAPAEEEEEQPAAASSLASQQLGHTQGDVLRYIKDFLVRGTRYKDRVPSPDGVFFPFPIGDISFDFQLLAAEAVLWRTRKGSATNLRNHLGGATGGVRLLRDTLIERRLMDRDTQQPITTSAQLVSLLRACNLLGAQAKQGVEAAADDLEIEEEEEALDLPSDQETVSV